MTIPLHVVAALLILAFLGGILLGAATVIRRREAAEADRRYTYLSPSERRRFE